MGAIARKLTRARLVMLPLWIASPLIYLGIFFVVFFPFGMNWYGYGVGVATAVVIGAWVRPRYRVTVLERSDRGVVYWVRRVRKSDEEAAEQPPSSVLTPRQ